MQARYNYIGDEADIDYQLATLSDIFFLDDDRKVMVETLPVEGTVGIYEDNEVLLDFVRHTPGIWHHWNADDDIKDGFRNPVEWEAI
ncbi:MAG: hypothetical protein E7277_00220 [Lachnospiraceae bacterium]|nr:hypothetical protein [Lachnospiraceae bacterium]